MGRTKHKWRFNNTRSSGSNSNPPSGSKQPLSVNERIEQLRREASKSNDPVRLHEISEVITSRSAPQELRQILQIPETAPIQPRPRQGVRRQLRRGTPGPPPPPSWTLASSRFSPIPALPSSKRPSGSHVFVDDGGDRVKDFSKLSQLPLGYHSLPKPGSLLDYSLKSMAKNWDWVRVAGEEDISALPIALRSCLLSYICRYESFPPIPASSLRVLFGVDSGDLARLDLTGLLSSELTLRDLLRLFAKRTSVPPIPDISTLNLEGKNPSSPDRESLPEDWQEQADELFSSPSLPKTIANAFPNLTHLSLADAGKYASWKDLLDIAPKLSKITHLSLANWPAPSMTPNSSTTYIATRTGTIPGGGTIPAGGTHLYSALRGDWEEAANILRRLSDMTYSLQWLDLEGCFEWLPALIWEDERSARQWAATGSSSGAGVAPLIKSSGPDWCGSWGQVCCVNVAQGVVPDDVRSITAVQSGLIQCQLLTYLRHHGSDKKTLPKDRQPAFAVHVPPLDVWDTPDMVKNSGGWTGWAILGWIENETECRRVALEIQLRRKRARGAYCRFDHGWEVPYAKTVAAPLSAG